MKAYCLSIAGDDDSGQAIVFAETGRAAKNLVHRTDLADALQGEWIYLRVNRAKEYDGMEKLDDAHLALAKWHNGWRWFDMDCPDADEMSDGYFLHWYKDNFGDKQ